MSILFVFLDEGAGNLYQVEQWIQPLRRLAQKHSVGVLHTNALVSELIRESGLTDHRVDFPNKLIEFLNNAKPALLLYPNQNTRNFYALRYPSAVHAWISHGESDKAYMVQNTLKRYDLYFAAGDAAADRVESALTGFNPDRILRIGRPQLLDKHETPSTFHPAPAGTLKVIYAPTWEGVTRATRYGSIHSHGLALVERLSTLGHQVVYRPHPLSGSREKDVAKSDREIRAFLLGENAENGTNHFVDESSFGWQLTDLDVMITDISAVAYDWLATGKPLIITEPADPKAVRISAPLFDSIELLSAGNIPELASRIVRAQDDGKNPESEFSRLSAKYFAGGSKGDALFTKAVEEALRLQTGLKSKPVGSYKSRAKRLGWLRYPNFIIRMIFKILGIWVTVSKRPPKTQPGELRNLFVHNSDPFNGESIRPVAKELFETARENGPIFLASNQVTSLLWVRLYFFIKNLNKTSKARVQIYPAVSAADSELLINVLRPEHVFYLKDHPSNLALLRTNSTHHVLYRPESDPTFEPSHALVMYDTVATNSPTTRAVVRDILEISRPGLAKLPY
ncbi:MAG: CDP-glycerol glycerophosphotransferase family protein [Microbacteriaceae bacterium]